MCYSSILRFLWIQGLQLLREWSIRQEVFTDWLTQFNKQLKSLVIFVLKLSCLCLVCKQCVSRCVFTANSCTWPPTCQPLISTWDTAWLVPWSEEARRATPSRWLTSRSSDVGIMRNLSPIHSSALQIRMSTRKAKRRK